MNDTRSRLAKCFAALFPELNDHEIASASPDSVGSWDSLASVTLMSLLEEEFSVEIPEEDLEHLVSFELVLGYLNNAKRIPSP